MAHTPGPWKWDDDEGLRDGCVLGLLLGPNGQPVASGLMPMEEGGVVQPILCNPDNARLIAAAPELLSSLEECVRLLDVLPIKYRTRADFAGNKARAVIAKAKGDV
jgi:hypothetical protein